MLRQPRQGRVRPERLIGGGHEQDEQKRTGHCRQPSEQRDEEARTLQRLQARRPQFVRRSGNGIAPADGRERKGEAEQVHEHRIEHAPARHACRGRRRGQKAPGHGSSHQSDDAPDGHEGQDAHGNPDAPRDAVGGEIQADPGPKPQQPGQRHRDHACEVFRSQEARQAPARDCRQRHGRGVLADDNAGEGREEEPFDQSRRSRGLGHPGAERLLDARHRAAGNEQRPALDVDGADEGAHHRRRQHEPGSRISERRSSDAGNEERGHAELCNRQRGRFPHRHEGEKRGRRQDDANLTTRSMLEWDGHRLGLPIG
jgi:hypothetical protein